MTENSTSASPGQQHLSALESKLSRLDNASTRCRSASILLVATALYFAFNKSFGREALLWLMVPVAALAWADGYQTWLREVFTARYDAFLKKPSTYPRARLFNYRITCFTAA